MLNPDWLNILLECIADHAAGAKTLGEFVAHRERRTRLAVIAGAYAEERGFPRVKVNGWEVGPGAARWTDFVMGCADPRFVGESLLELDALSTTSG